MLAGQPAEPQRGHWPSQPFTRAQLSSQQSKPQAHERPVSVIRPELSPFYHLGLIPLEASSLQPRFLLTKTDEAPLRQESHCPLGQGHRFAKSYLSPLCLCVQRK